MDTIEVTVGDIVVTNFNIYQHWSIVSDKTCSNGKPMLISATQRTGTVREESWDDVTQGHKTYVAKVLHKRPINECLEFARKEIDKWKYSITNNNCEHFINHILGRTMTSTQVKAGTIGAIIGVTAVGFCAEKPTFFKFLTGAVAVGGLAVLCSRADMK